MTRSDAKGKVEHNGSWFGALTEYTREGDLSGQCLCLRWWRYGNMVSAIRLVTR